jgi:hypothetical protein
MGDCQAVDDVATAATRPARLPREALPSDMQMKLDAAYLQRERRQCSQQDFEAGYLAALVDYALVP